jgi:hypothetical protein
VTPEGRDLDILKVGEMGREYLVATYWHPEERGYPVSAYLRDWRPEWPGFLLYRVLAPSGAAAKRAAMKDRTLREKEDSK